MYRHGGYFGMRLTIKSMNFEKADCPHYAVDLIQGPDRTKRLAFGARGNSPSWGPSDWNWIRHWLSRVACLQLHNEHFELTSLHNHMSQFFILKLFQYIYISYWFFVSGEPWLMYWFWRHSGYCCNVHSGYCCNILRRLCGACWLWPSYWEPGQFTQQVKRQSSGCSRGPMLSLSSSVLMSPTHLEDGEQGSGSHEAT